MFRRGWLKGSIHFSIDLGRLSIMIDMGLADRINANLIVQQFDAWTAWWHRDDVATTPADRIHALLADLHGANFQLWHQEDGARDCHAGDTAVADCKRAIDHINQQRNDTIERIDAGLLDELAKENLPNPSAELHSETPGMMLDRLSILSLKRYHTVEEIDRTDAPREHKDRNRERLSILDVQSRELADCVDNVWTAVISGRSRFKVYRQLKMYNDPDLNPVLYKNRDS